MIFKAFFEGILNVLYEYIIEILDLNFIMKIKFCYYIIYIEMLNDFKSRIRDIYEFNN